MEDTLGDEFNKAYDYVGALPQMTPAGEVTSKRTLAQVKEAQLVIAADRAAEELAEGGGRLTVTCRGGFVVCSHALWPRLLGSLARPGEAP